MEKIFIKGSIIGHASPRWKHPGKKDKGELNQQLSMRRADEVETFLQENFLRNLDGTGIEVDFSLHSFGDEDVEKIQVAALGVGDSVTIDEAEGDTNANDEAMRRVDINIAVTHQMEAEAGFSFNIIIPEECEDHTSDKWAIRLVLSGGAGHAGVGLTGALGELKNLKTGQKATGFFVGGGLGIGLQSPGADPGWGEWSEFSTHHEITFDHFKGTFCKFAAIGAGFLIGYSLAYIQFPAYSDEEVYVGGFNVASIGGDASVNVGAWHFSSDPPGARCIPEENLPGEDFVPYTYNIQDNLTHTVLFETQDDQMDEKELKKLDVFVKNITDRMIAAVD